MTFYLRMFLLSLLILACKNQKINKKSNVPNPKRELRGVWIATIENIDWPSKKTLSSEQQRAEFKNIIKQHAETGLNAAFVQVRAASDAFYGRQQEPWSEWLTGTQGKAPEPIYDPLAFMIDATHTKNMEFHAWLNLNRGVHKSAKSIAADHITKTKPEWFLSYGGYTLYDFGKPEVRAYIIDIVRNLVRNYDIDGIHFDDYFYPYTIENVAFPDQATFEENSRGINNIEDWRRDNIDILIKEIARTIKTEKPFVKFGISPFGIWKNKSTDPNGSDTQAGQTSHENLFADTRKWSLENWVDYMTPQIYFSTKHPKVPYETLTDWWIKNTKQRHLYIGMGAYKVNKDSDKTWHDPSEFPNQIRYNRLHKKISGAMFFSSKSLINNALGLNDSLKILYNTPALPPTMPWIKMPSIESPTMNTIEKINASNVKLSWSINDPNVRSVVVYKFEKNEKVDIENSKNIVSIVSVLAGNECLSSFKTGDRFILRSVDRLSNESKSSEFYTTK
jgi:uncharacterized lipoprotein YddW (UPF0748 family)